MSIDGKMVMHDETKTKDDMMPCCCLLLNGVVTL